MNNEQIRLLEIKNLISKKCSEASIDLTVEQIETICNDYYESSLSLEEIETDIDKKINDRKRIEEINVSEIVGDIERYDSITDIETQNIGITFNIQQIDLMMIANSNNPDELRETLSKIQNIRLSISDVPMTEEQFVSLRQRVFDEYKAKLVSRNDYYLDENGKQTGKIEYAREYSGLSEEQKMTFNQILSSSKSKEEIIHAIRTTFDEEVAHNIFKSINDFSPIEKDGIKNSTIEDYRKLHEELKKYNSITIDDDAKYYGVALEDGTFDFSKLQKDLDFARDNNMKVRLNALIFYMDCPSDIESLERSTESTKKAKEKLKSYITEITRFISQYNHENGNVVRSIDVFNELLNRYAISGEVPYMYRGDINQYVMSDGNVNDNIRAGWLKHLSIPDLCDVIAEARRELPSDIDFMYNDANLEDPNKFPAFVETMRQIREYEVSHGIRIIDTIGTQMHVDTDLKKNNIEAMLQNLSKIGLPIEITEFDMCVPQRLVDSLSETEIHKLKQQKFNEVCGVVNGLSSSCNITGFTIWSVNDEQNFMIGLENENLIKSGKQPITNLYGGYYANGMVERSQILKSYSRQDNLIQTAKINNQSTTSQVQQQSSEQQLSDETRYVQQVLGQYMSMIPEDYSMLSLAIQYALDRESQKVMNNIQNNNSSAAQMQINATNQQLVIMHGILARTRDTVDQAQELGCKNKTEYMSIITNLTEMKTQKNPELKKKAEMSINTFKEKKEQELSNSNQKEKPKVYVKKDPKISNNGVGSVLLISMLVGIIIGCIIGLVSVFTWYV